LLRATCFAASSGPTRSFCHHRTVGAMAAIGPRTMTAGDAAARRESLSRHRHETGSLTNESPSMGPAVMADTTIFTILGGTTIPDRAAIVRAELGR